MLNSVVSGIKIGLRKLNYAYFLAYSPYPKLLILLYHRVLPDIRRDPLGITVSEASFKKQIEVLAEKYPIISLQEAISQCKNGKTNVKMRVVLTFDDGYIDNYEIAYPYLKKLGIPASFFIATDCVGQKGVVWYNNFFNILDSNKDIKKLILGTTNITRNVCLPRFLFIREAVKIIKTFNKAEREKLILSLKNNRALRNVPYSDNDRFMSWDNLIEMSNHGMEIGSHGISHSSLACIEKKEALNEIKLSREIISTKLSKPCLYFSFPFGGKNDYNAGLIQYCKQVGYEACLLNVQGCNYSQENIFSYKRIIVNESFDIK